MSSSREASLSRSQRKKQDKIEQRRKDYEDQKLVDGCYCILTPLASSIPLSPFFSDRTPKFYNGIEPPFTPINEKELSTSTVHLAENSPMSASSSDSWKKLESSSALGQYIINHEGAILGSKASKSKLARHIEIPHSSVSPTHFRILFKGRQFYVYDYESKTGTYLRRNVYNYPSDCSHVLQRGRVLLTGRHIIEVTECVDQLAPLEECRLTLRLGTIGSSEHQVIRVAAKNLISSDPSLCSPEDDDNSAPETDEAKTDEDELDDMVGDNADEEHQKVKPSFESDDTSTAAVRSFSSTEGEIDTPESTIKEIENHVRFVNKRFYLKNDVSAGLRFFTKVKRWTSRTKQSNHLSSGDIIRAGTLEFRVDIRTSPRPITDKKTEEIVSAKDIGAFEYGNWLQREVMEDRHVVIDGFGKVPTDAFFGIYDGHAGRVLSDFVSCTFHWTLLQMLNACGRRSANDMSECMRQAFDAVGRMVSGLGEDSMYCGTTAVCGLLWSDEKSDERKITVGNIGDCRAFVCREGSHTELTDVHLATVPSEVERVEATGTQIVDGRLRGLTVTRAFGDLALSKSGVICTPHITEYKITSDDKFVVFACDGVWDVVQPGEVMELIRPYSNALDMCKALVHTAYSRQSDDNITAVIICL